MSKQKETTFGEKIDDDLEKAFGDQVAIFNIQQRGKIGDPDRLICLKGHFLAIELKTDSGTADEIQLLKLLKVKVAKGTSLLTTPSSWKSDLAKIKKVFLSL